MYYIKLKQKFYLYRRKYIYKWLSLLFCNIYVFILKNNYKYERVEKYLVDKWHDGFFYLVAYKDNKKYFFKGEVFGEFLENEVFFSKRLSDLLGEQCIISPVVSYRYFKSLLLAYDFMDEIEKKLDNEDINKIYEVVYKINKNGIFFRDLKRDNIIVLNDRILFFDFSFMYENSSDVIKVRDEHLLKAIGNNYRPSHYVWDDFYSLYKIANEEKIEGDVIKKIENMIGKFILNIDECN